MKYTLDYFIKKFEAIPESNWCINFYGNENIHCALGHCGVRGNNDHSLSYGTEGDELFHLIIDNCGCGVATINDGHAKIYQQPTPKQRILAALYDIKKMQQPKYPDITKQLAKFEIGDKTDLMTNEQKDKRSVTMKMLNDGGRRLIKKFLTGCG